MVTTATGGLTAGDILTQYGWIWLDALTGTLSVVPNSVATARFGAIVLQAADPTQGRVVIGANSTLTAWSTDCNLTGFVELVVGDAISPPSGASNTWLSGVNLNPALSAYPALSPGNVVVNETNTSGDSGLDNNVYFGPNGVLANTPGWLPSHINTDGAPVVIYAGSNPSSAIQLQSNVTINSTAESCALWKETHNPGPPGGGGGGGGGGGPPGNPGPLPAGAQIPLLDNLDLTDPDVVSYIVSLQHSFVLGGSLVVGTSGEAVGGNLVVLPGNLYLENGVPTIFSLAVPRSVTVDLTGFSSSRPIDVVLADNPAGFTRPVAWTYNPANPASQTTSSYVDIAGTADFLGSASGKLVVASQISGVVPFVVDRSGALTGWNPPGWYCNPCYAPLTIDTTQSAVNEVLNNGTIAGQTVTINTANLQNNNYIVAVGSYPYPQLNSAIWVTGAGSDGLTLGGYNGYFVSHVIDFSAPVAATNFVSAVYFFENPGDPIGTTSATAATSITVDRASVLTSYNENVSFTAPTSFTNYGRVTVLSTSIGPAYIYSTDGGNLSITAPTVANYGTLATINKGNYEANRGSLIINASGSVTNYGLMDITNSYNLAELGGNLTITSPLVANLAGGSLLVYNVGNGPYGSNYGFSGGNTRISTQTLTDNGYLYIENLGNQLFNGGSMTISSASDLVVTGQPRSPVSVAGRSGDFINVSAAWTLDLQTSYNFDPGAFGSLTLGGGTAVQIDGGATVKAESSATIDVASNNVTVSAGATLFGTGDITFKPTGNLALANDGMINALGALTIDNRNGSVTVTGAGTLQSTNLQVIEISGTVVSVWQTAINGVLEGGASQASYSIATTGSGLRLANLNTAACDIDITAGAGTLTVEDSAVITATGGDINLLLPNYSGSGIGISVGANSSIIASAAPPVAGSGPALGGNVTIAAGTPVTQDAVLESSPVNSVFQIFGGTVYAPSAGITSSAPTNTFIAAGTNVTLSSSTASAPAISVNGNATIEALGAQTKLDSLDLTDPRVETLLVVLQQAHIVGGFLTYNFNQASDTYTITGGAASVQPVNLTSTISADNIPAGVTLSLQGFGPAHPLDIALTGSSTTQQVLVGGVEQFVASPGANTMNVTFAGTGPSMLVHVLKGGELRSDAALTVLTPTLKNDGSMESDTSLTVKTTGSLQVTGTGVMTAPVTNFVAGIANFTGANQIFSARLNITAGTVNLDSATRLSAGGAVVVTTGTLNDNGVLTTYGNASSITVTNTADLFLTGAGGVISATGGGANSLIFTSATGNVEFQTSYLVDPNGTGTVYVNAPAGALIIDKSVDLQVGSGGNMTVSSPLVSNYGLIGSPSGVTLNHLIVQNAGGVTVTGPGRINAVLTDLESSSGAASLSQTGVTGTIMGASGGDFTVNVASGNVGLGNIATTGGSLTVVAASASVLTVNAGAQISIREGDITLNNQESTGTIVFGSGATVSAVSLNPSLSVVDVFIGTQDPVAANTFTAGSHPKNVLVRTVLGGQAYFDSGIAAPAGTDFVNVLGTKVVLDTGSQPASAISLAGGNTINASAGSALLTSLDFTDPRVLYTVEALQSAGFVGGQISSTGGKAIIPSLYVASTVTGDYIPSGYSVDLVGMNALNVSLSSATAYNNHYYMYVGGSELFSASGTTLQLNISGTVAPPAGHSLLETGSSGSLAAIGSSMTITLNGPGGGGSVNNQGTIASSGGYLNGISVSAATGNLSLTNGGSIAAGGALVVQAQAGQLSLVNNGKVLSVNSTLLQGQTGVSISGTGSLTSVPSSAGSPVTTITATSGIVAFTAAKQTTSGSLVVNAPAVSLDAVSSLTANEIANDDRGDHLQINTGSLNNLGTIQAVLSNVSGTLLEGNQSYPLLSIAGANGLALTGGPGSAIIARSSYQSIAPVMNISVGDANAALAVYGPNTLNAGTSRSAINIGANNITVDAAGSLNATASQVNVGSSSIVNQGSIVASNNLTITGSGGLTVTGGGSISAAGMTFGCCTGNVSVSQNSLTGLVEGTAGGDFLLATTTGNLTLGSIITGGGSISAVAATGSLKVTDGSALVANEGDVILENEDQSAGTISVGAGALVSAKTAGSAGPLGPGSVYLLIGSEFAPLSLSPASPLPSTPGTAPGNVQVINGLGGSAMLNQGFTALGSNNSINAIGGSVIISTGSASRTQAISFGSGTTGNVTVSAVGSGGLITSLDLMDGSSGAAAQIQGLQALGLVGGVGLSLDATGAATSGFVILKPYMLASTLTGDKVPQGVTVELLDFTSPSNLPAQSCSAVGGYTATGGSLQFGLNIVSSGQVVVAGTEMFLGSSGGTTVMNVSSSYTAGPSLVVSGNSNGHGVLAADGNLTINAGSLEIDGSIIAGIGSQTGASTAALQIASAGDLSVTGQQCPTCALVGNSITFSAPSGQVSFGSFNGFLNNGTANTSLTVGGNSVSMTGGSSLAVRGSATIQAGTVGIEAGSSLATTNSVSVLTGTLADSGTISVASPTGSGGTISIVSQGDLTLTGSGAQVLITKAGAISIASGGNLAVDGTYTLDPGGKGSITVRDNSSAGDGIDIGSSGGITAGSNADINMFTSSLSNEGSPLTPGSVIFTNGNLLITDNAPAGGSGAVSDLTVASTGSMQAANIVATGPASVFFTSSGPLVGVVGGTANGGDFVVTVHNQGADIGGVQGITAAGSVSVTADLGNLMIVPGSSITAQGGNLWLENKDAAAGSTIEFGHNVTTYSPGTSFFYIAAPQWDSSYTPGTMPKWIAQFTADGGHIYYGNASPFNTLISTHPPYNNIFARGSQTVVFANNTDPDPSGTILMDGAVVVNAPAPLTNASPSAPPPEIPAPPVEGPLPPPTAPPVQVPGGQFSPVVTPRDQQARYIQQVLPAPPAACTPVVLPPNVIPETSPTEKQAPDNRSWVVANGSCQPFTFDGDFGSVIVGSGGTAFAPAGECRLLLKEGKLLTVAGQKGMVVETAYGNIKVTANTIAVVEQKVSGMVRLTNLAGGPANFAVTRGGGAQTLSAGPGQEILLASDELSEEDLIPVDGADRLPIEGGAVVVARLKVKKTAFDQQMMADHEPLLSCNTGCLEVGARRKLEQLKKEIAAPSPPLASQPAPSALPATSDKDRSKLKASLRASTLPEGFQAAGPARRDGASDDGPAGRTLVPISFVQPAAHASRSVFTLKTGTAQVKHTGHARVAVEAAGVLAIGEGDTLVSASRQAVIKAGWCRIALAPGTIALISRQGDL